MRQIPAHRPRHTWPLAAGIAAGGLMCWISLSSAPLLRMGWQDWVAGELSAPAVILLATMAGCSLLALVWTAAEAEDR
ncbi:MAG TPA: hypothetical protein VGF97_01910 [Rhizomicrobium sp.]|jgi:hypothetical protein